MIRLSLSKSDKHILTQLRVFVDKGVEFQMPNIASLGTGKQLAVVYLEGEIQSSAPFRLTFERAVAGDARSATFIEAALFSRIQHNFGPEVAVSDYSLDSYKPPKVPVNAVVFRDDALLVISMNFELLRRTELEGGCLDPDCFTAAFGFQFSQMMAAFKDLFPGESVRLLWVSRGLAAPILLASCQNVTIYTTGIIESSAHELVETVQFL